MDLDRHMKYSVLHHGIQYTIGRRTMGSLQGYLRQRETPSDFLNAVLSNNLTSALFIANSTEIDELFAVIHYLWNEAPGDSWGSQDAVRSWLAGTGKPRLPVSSKATLFASRTDDRS